MVTADTIADAGEGRRLSIEKKPIIVPDADHGLDNNEPSAFERLPDEIVQQILRATDANGFASLALLNTKWRSVAQQAHLYALHLANCPSYAMSHNAPPEATSDDDLPRLRRLFAKEVKRNLFEAYLRPNQTVIKIISNSISSSSCPGGEGIQFSPSPKGHHLLAYNSSRIHVIDLRTAETAVRREFKILRRPAATCINDEGTTLAVLLTEMEVDIYDLTETPPKRTRSMILDHSPRAIALSPCGSVLAAAYEGGIEVSSLNPGAAATDRRAVKCDGVDTLTFSFDGTQILGTTVQSSQPNTVILTAPYYDPGSHMADDDISALWTTSILFPNTSRDCSHAVLVQNGKYEEAAWTFTYDRSFETFRAVRIDDLRNGTTYFTGPVPSPNSQARLLPCTLPAASYFGELVSAGFQGKEIWLYGVPEDLGAVPDAGADSGSSATGLSRRNSGPSIRSSVRIQENSESGRVPQWQILCDKFRNTFVAGSKIGELEGINMVKFVADFADSCMKERLVVAARGVAPNISVTDEEGIDFVDGGRITIMDFDYSVTDGAVQEYTIEVGSKEPEELEEEHRDMATEVAIVRRRTVAQRRGSRSAAVMRSVTSAVRPPPLPTQPPTEPEADEDDPLLPRRVGTLAPRSVEQTEPSEEPEGLSMEEQEALDAPYAHASPRSGTTLRRAATAAANNRRLHPSATATSGHIVYRRADGRAEHPHESDADNWVPPPPPYQKDDPGDLPSFLRHASIVPLAGSSARSAGGQTEQSFEDRKAMRNSSASMHQQHRRVQTVSTANRYSSPVPPVPPLPSMSDIPPVPPMPALPPGVAGSSIPPMPPLALASSHERGGSLGVPSSNEDGARPASRDSRYLDGDNIYDVSPPDSPSMPPVRQHVSREPSDTGAASSPEPIATGGLVPAPANQVSAAGDPLVRRISVSRTWPIQPMPINTNTTPAGYPYSAPPVNDAEPLSQSFPPLPRGGEQMPGYSNRTSASRPLSGSFPLPGIPTDYHMGGEHNWRRTSYQRPVSQQQHYSFPRQRTESPMAHYHARATTIHEPQPRRPYDMSPALPGEDIPLIISTPKGVSGAFDAPERHPSEYRAETPILSPVPRHPRPQTQASILRPAQERLDTIYSSSTSAPAAALSFAPPPPPPLLLPPGSSLLSVPPAPGSTSSTNGGLSARRVPSLSRKASRAERSAAKNVADAKRRGWSGRSTRGKSGRRKGGKKKSEEREFDVVSSAAWTDITVTGYSVRSAFTGGVMGGGRGNGRDGRDATIDRVQEWMGLGKRFGHPDSSDGHNAAVILVSRTLAAWLDDDAFVSRMLAATGMSHGPGRELTVLAAAVDEVPRYDRRLDLFGSSEGVSVLCRDAGRVLPHLWDAEAPAAITQRASLEFRPAKTRFMSRLGVNVPLANTLFANGRQHALVASRWHADERRAPSLVEKTQRTSQTIVLSTGDLGFANESRSTVAAHLVPLTPARKVLDSLGNILSQVEINGQSAPASRELEAIVPLLLQQRRKLRDDKPGQDHPPGGPVGIWALTIPERYINRGPPLPEPLQLDNYRSEDELRLARATSNGFDQLISSGCKLHKVLSGGGGWGPKQGLLSLDPQTEFATDELQDMQSFIDSFKGNAGGIVNAGTYVQFFTESAYPTEDVWSVPSARLWDPSEVSRTVTTVLGTSGAVIGASPFDSVTASPSLFGAVSSAGVYLSQKATRRSKHSVATKMDTPRSYLVSDTRFRPESSSEKPSFRTAHGTGASGPEQTNETKPTLVSA
ncbi:hypothetical protein C8A00DRAFT_16259 [Chaetomidium leptoderma]|uniref:F-box domain-containing protein n=1 Tax=Chaetomidium leptoderma TaxID=669021 RepID=A0AAN6ZUI3_9PEZI|nr:hypothetical protein C8A00DRAFT_16259 [Chaetomidium leptoderma]